MSSWMANRIRDEFRKHKNLDWAEIASIKIRETFREWVIKQRGLRSDKEIVDALCIPEKYSLEDKEVKHGN